MVENEPVASDHLPVWVEISITDRSTKHKLILVE
jgi:hypothetical protein